MRCDAAAIPVDVLWGMAARLRGAVSVVNTKSAWDRHGFQRIPIDCVCPPHVPRASGRRPFSLAYDVRKIRKTGFCKSPLSRKPAFGLLTPSNWAVPGFARLSCSCYS